MRGKVGEELRKKIKNKIKKPWGKSLATVFTWIVAMTVDMWMGHGMAKPWLAICQRTKSNGSREPVPT